MHLGEEGVGKGREGKRKGGGSGGGCERKEEERAENNRREGKEGDKGGGATYDTAVTCVPPQDLLNDYYCECVMGWEDKNCSVETNECINRPCLNGATCNVSYIPESVAACVHCCHATHNCNRYTASTNIWFTSAGSVQ